MTRLTRSQVTEWVKAAKEYEGDHVIPSCAVLNTADEVYQLCSALLDAWSHGGQPAPEVAETPTPEGA